MLDFRKELNAEQYEAVSYCDGPSLVIAGAGSGKTRVLTYKIAYLLEHDYNPWSILALTFTNKAAKEMLKRISSIVEGYMVNSMWCGTFHSIFARLLRIEAEAIGVTSNFSIYDSQDSQRIIKRIVKDLDLDNKVYTARIIANRISMAKNNIILPYDYANNYEIKKQDESKQISRTYEIYSLYMEQCKKNNALDFDDLLLYTYLLLNKNKTIREKYQNRFEYILVDEYQDTNLLQSRIIELLTNKEKRLCVVGDDAQSIYAFRGAEIQNILNFEKQYANAKIIKLEQNYRSTENIVNAANSLIAKNKKRIPKTVYSKNGTGNKLFHTMLQSDKDEVYYVLQQIRNLYNKKNVAYSDIAILYRTNAQSRSFEEVFRKAQLPYRIYGGLSFYARKEIKDIIAYFSLICNPMDDEALLRVINYPTRGIGNTSLDRIRTFAANGSFSLWECITNIERADINLSKAVKNKILAFAHMINDFRERLHRVPAFRLAQEITEKTGLIEHINKEDLLEKHDKLQNVHELLNAISEFSDERKEQEGKEITFLDDYLPQVALLTDQDQKDDDPERVSLMTVHSAKGLEYDAVFVTGLEDGLFPNPAAEYDLKEREEERRLFYVAITRAKSYCFLSHARSRMQYGQYTFSSPSQFLNDIDKQYLKEGGLEFSGDKTLFDKKCMTRTAATVQQISKPILPKSVKKLIHKQEVEVEYSKEYGIRVGSIIKHQRFGKGRVTSIEGGGNETKAAIEFDNAGKKNLLMKFAKFEVIER